MNAKAVLAACQALGIAIVSAAVLFVLHRTLSSDGPWSRVSTFGFGNAADRSMEPGEAQVAERDPRAEDMRGDARRDADEPALGTRTEAGAANEAAEAADAPRTNPHIEALSHPSPTYRNSSLAAAIRDAGHVCTDVLSSAAGDEDLKSWRVSCDGGRAYLVFADGDELRVEPMLYWDAPPPIVPAPVDPTEFDPRQAPPILQPRR